MSKNKKGEKDMSMWRWMLLGMTTLFVSVLLYCYFNFGNCLFFARFLYEPGQTGSIAPTSRIAATELIQPMLATQSPRHILEVGAGTGPVTEVIVEHLKPDDVFDVIEVDDVLCGLLKKKFGHHEQVRIHCMFVQDWHPGYQYDAIISTVPLMNLTAGQIKPILRQFEKHAKSDGTVSYLEYIGGAELKKLLATKDESTQVQKKLALFEAFRNKHDTSTVSVVANVPPTYVHHVKIGEN